MAVSSTHPARACFDLGGATGYGAVPYSASPPTFHHPWEKQVFGMMPSITAAAATRPGMLRYAIERLARSDYFDNGYYGRWLAAFELLLSEADVTPSTPAAQRAARATSEVPPHLPAALPATVHSSGDRPSFVRRDLDAPPRFAVGERVRTKRRNTDGHTRMPAYAAQRPGTIASVLPAEVLPDATAIGIGEYPQHVYSVAFNGPVLWGDGTDAALTVHVDLYECYLLPDPDTTEPDTPDPDTAASDTQAS